MRWKNLYDPKNDVLTEDDYIDSQIAAEMKKKKQCDATIKRLRAEKARKAATQAQNALIKNNSK